MALKSRLFVSLALGGSLLSSTTHPVALAEDVAPAPDMPGVEAPSTPAPAPSAPAPAKSTPAPAPEKPAPAEPAPAEPAPAEPKPAEPKPAEPIPATPAPATPAPATPPPAEPTPTTPATPAPATPAATTPTPADAAPLPATPAPLPVQPKVTAPAPQRKVTVTVDEAPRPTEEEIRFVEMVNRERARRGLSQLSIDPLLIAVAREHSAEMRDKNYFNHTSPTPGIKTPLDRYLKATSRRPPYACVGENLFYCSVTDVDRGHVAFMNSPTHRENVLFPRFEKIGVGIVKNEKGEFWVTQMYLTNRDPNGGSRVAKRD